MLLGASGSRLKFAAHGPIDADPTSSCLRSGTQTAEPIVSLDYSYTHLRSESLVGTMDFSTIPASPKFRYSCEDSEDVELRVEEA